MELSTELEQGIRAEANYQGHAQTLVQLNAPRFRTLGPDRCRAFVAQGVWLGDELGFTRRGSVAYLLHLMNWLGSFFYSDPRYAAIYQGLCQRGAEAERIEQGRQAFIAFADRHIGASGDIVIGRLARLEEVQPLVQDHRHPPAALHDALLGLFQIGRADTYDRAFIERQALDMAVALGLDTETGRRVCLVLTVVLGVRCDMDPLYPWIGDTVRQAGADGRPAADALADYARKRLTATLRDAAADRKG